MKGNRSVTEDHPSEKNALEQAKAHGRSLADRMVLRALLIALDQRGEPDAFLSHIRQIVHDQISGLNTAHEKDGPVLKGVKLGAREVADMLTMPVDKQRA